MALGLDQLGEDFLRALCESQPFWATALGAAGFDDRVPDLSDEGQAAQRDRYRTIRSDADALPDEGLDADELTSKRVLQFLCDLAIGSLDARAADYSVAPFYTGAQAPLLQFVAKVGIADGDAARAYLTRLAGVAGYLDGAVDRLRSGARAGRTPVRRAAAASVQQLTSHLDSALESDPLRLPQPPEGWADGAEWSARRDEILAGSVRPALDRLRAVLADELLPVARPDDRSGLCWLADGQRLYAAEVAVHTTDDTATAESLHELGLHTLAGLDDELALYGTQAFGLSQPGEVLERLRTDPELEMKDLDEVLGVAARAVRRAQEELPAWFRDVADVACEVRALPDVEAQHAIQAYYGLAAADGSRPGVFWVNHRARHTRFELPILAAHEAVPGHHLQITTAQQLTGLPAFRRLSTVTTYTEGWALYTERLADEMGLYEDPVSRLGMVAFDAWRAARLVVDTGLHHFGWSRERAVNELSARTALSPAAVEVEVDRYIAWPGQALSYLTGRAAIDALRAKAQSELADAFDIRDFHAAVLGSGTLPVAVLRDVVDRWVAATEGSRSA